MKLVPGKLYRLKCDVLFGTPTEIWQTNLQALKTDSILLFIEGKKSNIAPFFSNGIEAYFLNSKGKIIYSIFSTEDKGLLSLKSTLELLHI